MASQNKHTCNYTACIYACIETHVLFLTFVLLMLADAGFGSLFLKSHSQNPSVELMIGAMCSTCLATQPMVSRNTPLQKLNTIVGQWTANMPDWLLKKDLMRMKKRFTTKILKWFYKFQNEEISVVDEIIMFRWKNTTSLWSQLLLEFFLLNAASMEMVSISPVVISQPNHQPQVQVIGRSTSYSWVNNQKTRFPTRYFIYI